MTRVRVSVTKEHLHQLRGTPAAGLIELVNNALDADATDVRVVFHRHELGGLSAVSVTDNGLGMTVSDLTDYFGPIGSSWKQHNGKYVTPSGRRLLGQKGRGRIGAFAIGPVTEWVTTAVEPDKSITRKQFSWKDDADSFEFVSEVVETDDEDPETVAGPVPTGTTVTVTDVYPAADRITGEQDMKSVRERLAVYLVKYPKVAVYLDGVRMDPEEFVTRRTKLKVPMGTVRTEDPHLFDELANTASDADVDVLEWTVPVTRELLCFDSDPGGLSDVMFELPARVRAPGISYNALVRWDGVPALAPTAEAGDLSPAVAAIKQQVETALRTHLRGRADENRMQLLTLWKNEGSYPYSSAPPQAPDAAERDLFDLVAVTASPAFTQTDKKTRTFALELLKTTIRSDASALRRVLEGVLDLDETHLNDIDELLQRTSLVSMIELGKVVTERVRFVDWLEVILDDDIWVARLRERGGLQSLMEENTWVFGDQWQTLLTDRGLQAAAIEARDLVLPLPATGGPVVDAEGRTVRVDLMLARSMRAAGRRQHLVIELKRPSRTIAKADLGQVENYVDTVMSSPRFDDGRIDWVFMLVGRKFDDHVTRRRSQSDRPHGLVDTQRLPNGATYQLWVHSWAEVIEDARGRLAFVREHLDEVPRPEDLQALTDTHRHLLGDDTAI